MIDPSRHTFLITIACTGLLALVLTGCAGGETGTLFEQLPSEHTNINFSNQLSFDREFNIKTYQNFYNGGGAGIGDLDNDGRQDIYLTSNMESNKLYLNEGNFQFKDVTGEAGVAGSGAWSTGVSLVDINADGWLDIYVCNAGLVDEEERKNELFINNKDGTFTDKAEEYGLADPGYSTHAAFFDYDRDGDLDVYIVNNSPTAGDEIEAEQRDRNYPDKRGGDRLMRNDNGMFTDVTEQSGIYRSIIGYGLGISVSDLDKDGWLDMYISNDFFERDYIYMNNGDGTFREVFTDLVRSSSVSSMGADIADFTGDGYPEIFVTEMLQESEERLKTNMDYHTWDDYQYYLNDGYYHQFSRNTLQYHKGIIPGKGIAFSEVGRMADVHATDWSWAANIFDMDNDGHKDLFVSNGLYQDILNKDYMNYVANPRREFFMRQGTKMVVDIKKMIEEIPSNRIPNYAYQGGGDLTFTKKTKAWGLNTPSFSNGSAYGDLNNDGHLDLVVNNVNMHAFVYRNQGGKVPPRHNWLKVDLKGSGQNRNAIGAKVTLKVDGQLFYQEQIPQRGFQSSVDNRLNFGLGEIETIDTLRVEWPYGKQTTLTDVTVNQSLTLDEAEASNAKLDQNTGAKQPLFRNVTSQFPLSYRHIENEFSDFEKNPLLFHMKSTEGPKVAKGDVNGDGRPDLYIGGARGQAGQLFIQRLDGSFEQTNHSVFEADSSSEDLAPLFFDADGDGDLDLYVTSGGNEAPVRSSSYLDRLYINDGSGQFVKSPQKLPAGRPESTSTVEASDIDGDGDLDLFVGVRLRPGLPGIPQQGYLLENDGTGTFTDITQRAAPALENAGNITDASFGDFDGDGDQDLLVAGRWMPLKLFANDGSGNFTEQTEGAGLAGTAGWWNTLETGDIDGDGDIDAVAGNIGLNSEFQASSNKPMHWYTNDFDRNGTIEQIITTYNGEQAYPLISRDEMVDQVPRLESTYPTNAAYAGQTMNNIFTEQEMQGAVIREMTMLESVNLRNNGDGTFFIEPLPRAAQVSPVFAILLEDLDADGNKDLLMGGNLHNVKPQIGRYDASYGTYFRGTPAGQFQYIQSRRSGLALDGEVRDFVLMQGEDTRPKILVIRNDDTLEVLEFNPQNSVSAR